MSLPTSGTAPPPPPKAGLNLKVAGEAPAKGKGGKPPVVKPGKVPKPGSVLRKRSALSPVAKVGIAVFVIALAVAGIFFYQIFFPKPSKVIEVRIPVVAKPGTDAKAAAAKAAADAAKGADAAAAKKAADQAAEAQAVPTPTPTPAVESVMAPSSIDSDVQVTSTHIDAAPAASAAFRTFVAGATIGGVFQGHPSRALINGTIVREGQMVENSLGISFERIDAANKVIYFRDTTGAEVSKNY
jgi:hypothetical protein